MWQVVGHTGSTSTGEQKNLQAPGEWGQVPRQVTATATVELWAATARWSLAERELSRLVGALEEAGVPAVVVKGPAVAAYYPEPALRTFGDLDLLVLMEQLGPAEAALNGLGYYCSKPGEWALDHHFHLPPMASDGDILTVDLHWRLDDPERVGCLPTADLWARSETWLIQGSRTARLDGVDQVLHLCRHAMVQHLGRLGLQPLCDLVLITGSWEAAEWQTLVQRAEEYRLQRAVGFALLLAQSALEMELPEGVLAELGTPRDDSESLDLAKWFLTLDARTAVPVSAQAVRARRQGALPKQVSYLLRHMFPGPKGMSALYGIPVNSPRIWLTYLRRPVDLIQRYGRSAADALWGDPGARAAWGREAWLERWLSEDVGNREKESSTTG
jgi:hypothetical protein